MSVRLPHKVKNPAGENFYAATDIVIKVGKKISFVSFITFGEIEFKKSNKY